MKKLILLLVFITTMTFGCSSNQINTLINNTDGTESNSETQKNNQSIIHNLMSSNDFVVEFENTSMKYNDISDDIWFDEIRSIQSEENSEIEIIEFILIYETDDMTGNTLVTVELEVIDEQWHLIELSYFPIGLTFTGTLPSTLTDDITESLFSSGMFLEAGVLNHTFEVEQLKALTPLSSMRVISNNELQQDVTIKVGMNVIDATTIAKVNYVRNDQNKWVLSQVIIDHEQTRFDSPRELLGRWGAPYKYEAYGSFGILVVQEFDELTSTYKGIFKPHRRMTNGHISKKGLYEVFISYDLGNDQLVYTAGDWIEESSDYPKFDFTMTFDDNMDLYCLPTNWVKETSKRFKFTQDCDTYQVYNNETLILTVGASTYKDEHHLELDLDMVTTYLNATSNDEGLYLEANGLSHLFMADQITTILPLTEAELVRANIMAHKAKIKFGMNVIEATTVATIEYTLNDLEEWIISDIIIDNNRTEFSSPRELIGRWSEDYQLNGRKYFGVLVVDELIEDGYYYTGKYIFAKHATPKELVMTSRDRGLKGIYEVTLEYDLANDQIIFSPGDWILDQQGMIREGQHHLDITMTFDDNLDLYALPVNWTNEETSMFVFDQNGDTYDYD